MAMTMITTAVIVGFLSLLALLLRRSFLLPWYLRLPPGPRPLPIVGNLLMLRNYASPDELANGLKRKYGPIVTFWMGSKPWIFVSGPELLQEALITQGSVFMGRHQPPSLRILTADHRNLLSGHGERAHFLRRLLVSEVLSNKRMEGFRPIREREIDILVESLKKQLRDESNGGIVTNFRLLIRMTVCNLIVGILFGRRLILEEYLNLDEVLVEIFQRLVLGKLRDFIPFLSCLPDKKGVQLQLEIQSRLCRILEPLIEERREGLKSGKTDQTTMVDILLKLQGGESKSPIEILDIDIVLICVEVLQPGTATNSLNLEYCIAHLINHPEMQEKLAQEIFAVVGKRVVDENDIAQLPYLQAVVKESLRRHSPIRMVPRRSLSATKLACYSIPQNTPIIEHLEAVSLSPEIWENPLEFRPERFLNKTVDITGSPKITMIPFGLGRRICPAINIAFLHSELILARLIQTFDWKPAIPGQILDVSPDNGPAAPMKYPLVASLQERLMFS